MSNRVLVTGAAGFLGGATARFLRQQAYDVVATGRSAHHEIRGCHLHDLSELISLLNDVRPDAIVHCAAMVDFGPGALVRQYATNVLVPGVMADWCMRHNVYFVQISSVVVHGVFATHIGSQTPVAPDTDYGRSKFLAEQLVDASGAASAILRFGGLYGVCGPNHLGLNRAVRAARDGSRPTVVGTGQARRNYLHVDHAARIIEFCLKERIQGVRWAGGGEILTMRQILETVCDVYLPGHHPIEVEGAEAKDQIIDNSPDLPVGPSMAEALRGER